MPHTIEPPSYEPNVQVRTVQDTGWISFKGRPVICPRAFTGRRVALRPAEDDGVFDLCYRSHLLARIDLRQNITQTVLDVPERVSSISPV